MDTHALLNAITGKVPAAQERPNTNRPALTLPAAGFLAGMQCLRDDPRFAFDFLMDHTAIDWITDNEFELVYQLFSTVHGHELMVSLRAPRDNAVVPSVIGLWPIAEWQEREVYDLFGVQYDGHPDLRRLFLEDGWQGFPLRKDYQDANMLQKPD